MSARQHLLTDDDLAGLWVENRELLAALQTSEATIHDLRRQVASARHPTVPADSVFDPHPADVIPR